MLILYMVGTPSEAILRIINELPPEKRQSLPINDIARSIGRCEKTVRLHIKSLRSNGYLTVSGKTGTAYTFEVSDTGKQILRRNNEQLSGLPKVG